MNDDNSKKIFSKNLNFQLKRNNKTQTDLAKFLNVTTSTVSDWCNGKKFPRIDKIQKIADWMRINKSDLIEEKSNIDKFNDEFIKLPVYGSLCCGNGGFNDDNIEEFVAIPSKMLKKGKEYFCNYAKGDSMTGERIYNGDLIIFEKTNYLENSSIGCFCVDDNEAMCKIFKKDDKTNIIMLLPANEKYDPVLITLENTNFRIIGKLAIVINNRQ